LYFTRTLYVRINLLYFSQTIREEPTLVYNLTKQTKTGLIKKGVRMNKQKEKLKMSDWELKTFALPKSLIRDSIAEAERRNYGKGIKALQALIHEQLLPFARENTQQLRELS
jgi:hypothetical protein